MSTSNPPTNPPSRLPTPAPAPASTPNPRFTSQASTAEDLLKSHTVGLVHLSDFRKRRAEALEQKEREATGGSSLGRFTPASHSGAATPHSDGASTPRHALKKKKRKNPPKGKLSFGLDDDDDNADEEAGDSTKASPATTPGPSTPSAPCTSRAPSPKRRLGPSPSLPLPPTILTKAALLRDAQTREQLRKEFLARQDAVRATEILIPFVFYDGTNIPGGACRVKKGDPIWVFLDRSRKVGAELGVGGTGGAGAEKAASRREWARVGVDDLMLVRGEVIVPHHYDFYYFIVNKTLAPTSLPLFDYSALPPSETSTPSRAATPVDPATHDPLSRPSRKPTPGASTPLDSRLEGCHDDPNVTKVVDRRWYERNKHIFPASVWEEFDAGKDYTRGMRRDAEGNAFFFS